MKLKTICFASLIATLAACSNQPEQGPISSQLVAQGFDSPTSIATPDGAPADETATSYRSPDGRIALVISDDHGEKAGIVFDRSGSVVDRVTPAANETAYCWTCDLGYWSCYGSCAVPCWAEDGFGSGCSSDCSQACNWWESNICNPQAC